MKEYPEQLHTFDSCLGGSTISAYIREGTVDLNNVRAVVEADEYNFKGVPLEDGITVLDFGAHIGAASLLIASLGFPNVKIYAYEPLPENIELMKKNIALNNFQTIFPVAQAVDGKPGTIEIRYGDARTDSGSQHYFIGCPWYTLSEESCIVQAVSLENIFEEHKIERCRLIKLDCEGTELALFAQCPKEIFQRIDFLVGEHHFHRREILLEATKGVFEDVSCSYQSLPGSSEIGNFWFRRKGFSG